MNVYLFRYDDHKFKLVCVNLENTIIYSKTKKKAIQTYRISKLILESHNYHLTLTNIPQQVIYYHK